MSYIKINIFSIICQLWELLGLKRLEEYRINFVYAFRNILIEKFLAALTGNHCANVIFVRKEISRENAQ